MTAFTVILNVPTIQQPTGFRLIDINAFTSITNQSIEIHKGDVTLLFDGYIYNLPALYRNIHTNTYEEDQKDTKRVDYSILIDIYCEFGMEYLLQVLDGTFRFVLLDQRLSLDDSQMYIVNDSMGIRPIYQTIHVTNDPISGNMYTFTTNTSNQEGRDTGNMLQPGTCCKFTLANRVRSCWKLEEQFAYSLLGKSGGFPRIMYDQDGYGTSTDIIPDFQEFTKKITEYHLSCAIDKHLLFRTGTIFCVVSHDDYESRIIVNLASRINGPCDLRHDFVVSSSKEESGRYESNVDSLPQERFPIVSRRETEVPETNDDQEEPEQEPSNINIVKISIDNLSDTSPASILTFIRDSCQQYNKGVVGSYHVWMSSGLLHHETQLRRVTKSIMSYDHSYREYLHKIGEDHLIQPLIEPGKEMGLEIAFPFLERSWLQYYVSIHPHYRYSTSIVEESMKDYL